MAFWALATRFWTWLRLWPWPPPDRRDGTVTRGLVVDAAAGVVATPELPALPVLLELPVPLVPVLAPEPLVADAEVVWSDSRVAFARARAAWAAVTALRSGAGSMVARAWPTATASPTDTGTLVTVPAAGKLSVTWLTRWTDPVRLRCCSTEPVVTVVVR